MTPSSHSSSTLSIPELRNRFTGRLITPDDSDYDAVRTVMYGGNDLKPSLVVRVADVDDVAAAVTLARESGLELAVRSGGHSGAGHSTTDGGIVLDLRDLKQLEIDPEHRTVWADAGLTAGEVTVAAAEHRLAVGFGDTGSVGVGGITLGGGVGFLSRKHGLTIDSLLAAEIVTADGGVLRVDDESHPELFWAIRGGGGNFGVVTRFCFRLHPLQRIVGGMLILPATAETIAGFIAAAEAAPDELSTIANVLTCPPMPFVPPEHHGNLVIMALVCYAGDPQDGERAIAPLRALAKPIADLVKTGSYPEMFPPEDPDYHPTAVARTLFVDHVDRPVAETILERLRASDASLRVAQLRVLGGAIARVPADATAYAHRASPIMVNIAAFYDGPDDRPRREAWVVDFAAALHQGDDGVYVNFLGDEDKARVRAAYPDSTWDRLTKAKARYDPTNLFRRNQNIPPAGQG
ncbi:MAG: FAD-binding oxidoreductase [Jiangellaceae bacterium]